MVPSFVCVKMAALTHGQRVTRLYRHSMKNLLSWCVEREVWRREALKLRAEFDAFKHVTDRSRIAQLVENGEERLRRQAHPDPYIHPLSPDGGKWERNMPPPKHSLIMTPDEEQWHNNMSSWAAGGKV